MEIKTAPTTSLVGICTVLQFMFLHVLPGVMLSEHQRYYYKLTLGKKNTLAIQLLSIYIERTLIFICYSHSLEILLFEYN